MKVKRRLPEQLYGSDIKSMFQTTSVPFKRPHLVIYMCLLDWMRNYYNYLYPAIQPKRAILGRQLKVSLFQLSTLVERNRWAGEFLLISVFSSHALSLSCSLLVQVMTCASWMMPPVTQVRSHVWVVCVSAVVYRVSLSAVFTSTWLIVIVLLTQATSLDKCSSNFGRRSVCLCVCVCICIGFW